MLLVTEQQIADAIRWMFRHHGWVIEGSAAVGIAAIMNELIPADDVSTVAIITGGNIDADKFLALMTTSS
jgi:threonine dehydratase